MNEQVIALPEGATWRNAAGGTSDPVQAACDDRTGGYWYCVSHAEALLNNLAKSIHINEPGKHEMVWLCITHGFETPGPQQP